MRKTYQDAKHLGYEPPVARDARPVFEQLFLSTLDVVHNVFSKGVLATNRKFALEKPGSTYVFASMRWIISDCSLTMAASWPKLLTKSAGMFKQIQQIVQLQGKILTLTRAR